MTIQFFYKNKSAHYYQYQPLFAEINHNNRKKDYFSAIWKYLRNSCNYAASVSYNKQKRTTNRDIFKILVLINLLKLDFTLVRIKNQKSTQYIHSRYNRRTLTLVIFQFSSPNPRCLWPHPLRLFRNFAPPAIDFPFAHVLRYVYLSPRERERERPLAAVSHTRQPLYSKITHALSRTDYAVHAYPHNTYI